MSTDTETAQSQARAQVASIAEMVAALDVDYGRLEELRDERKAFEEALEEATEKYDDAEGYTPKMVEELAAALITAEADLLDWIAANTEELEDLEDAAGDCTSREDAEQRIHEDALSVEYRSGWATPGAELEPEEFKILLCTGGPHVEIQGDIDEHGEPSRPRIIYKDWGESGELFDFDRDSVLTYCQQFIIA